MVKQLSTQRGGYLEALLSGSPVAIMATNADGIITFANSEACKLLERDMRELVGESIAVAYEDLAAAKEANRQIYLHGGVLRDYEANARTKSGKIIRVRISAAHLKDSAGNYAGAVGFFETYRPWTEAESRNQSLVQDLQSRLNACQDIATPVYELFPGLLMLVISCPVEPSRLDIMTASLLHRMRSARTRVVMIDLSCLACADAGLVGRLVKTMRSISLCGAKCILAGIQPEVAQVLEPMIGDLTYLKSFSSVEMALEAAFDSLGYELKRKTG